MPKTDPRVDAYIAKSAEFARPILEHLRAIVHATCPDVVETMKWSFPHFDYKDTSMCSMASFKAHCVFGFWKGSLVLEEGDASNEAMGQFGRITSVKELPSKTKIAGYIRKAMKLNDAGVKVTRTVKERADVGVHPEFEKALKKNKPAQKQFDMFTPGKRREYCEWIAEAKADATRAKRIDQAVEWIAEGKSRNWKYQDC